MSTTLKALSRFITLHFLPFVCLSSPSTDDMVNEILCSSYLIGMQISRHVLFAYFAKDQKTGTTGIYGQAVSVAVHFGCCWHCINCIFKKGAAGQTGTVTLFTHGLPPFVHKSRAAHPPQRTAARDFVSFSKSHYALVLHNKQ